MDIADIKVGMRLRRTQGAHLYMGEGDVGIVVETGERLRIRREACGTYQATASFDEQFFEYAGPGLKDIIVAGRKDDSGKLDMTLLDDMPRALAAITEVMQWAITKKKPKPYDRASWLGVHADRYRAAILRHNRDACQQGSRAPYEAPRFERDKETELLHLAHMACSAMMALENTLREIELEQEAKNAVPKD